MAAKKKELDILYERKANADSLYAADASKLPLSQMNVYLAITKRIHVLEDIRFLVNTAPESMNPGKYTEHLENTLKYVYELCDTEALQEFYATNEANLKQFVSGNVSDYKKAISAFLVNFLNIWKSEKNYK